MKKVEPFKRRDIIEVTGFQSSDGKIHDTLQEAKKAQALIDLDEIVYRHLPEDTRADDLVHFFQAQPLAWELIKDIIE